MYEYVRCWIYGCELGMGDVSIDLPSLTGLEY